MKFDCLVKHNGIYYKAGEEVPIDDQKSVGVSAPIEKPIEKPIQKPIEVKSEKVEEIKVEPTIKFTKTEINRMSTKELRELANKNGINGDDFNGSELKTMLIDKLV